VKPALALLLVLAVAGCGGGDSRENYVDDATAICVQMTQRIKDLGVPESFTDTQLYARRAKDAVGDGIRDLRELEPPEEYEDGYERYLATLEARRRQLDLLTTAADENSMAAIQEAGSELDVLNAKGRQDARRAGIGGCEDG
jgi:hypothetical protein